MNPVVSQKRGFSLIVILLMVVVLMMILAKFGGQFSRFIGPPATLEDVENIPEIKDRTNTLEQQIKDRYPGN